MTDMKNLPNVFKLLRQYDDTDGRNFRGCEAVPCGIPDERMHKGYLFRGHLSEEARKAGISVGILVKSSEKFMAPAVKNLVCEEVWGNLPYYMEIVFFKFFGALAKKSPQQAEILGKIIQERKAIIEKVEAILEKNPSSDHPGLFSYVWKFKKLETDGSIPMECKDDQEMTDLIRRQNPPGMYAMNDRKKMEENRRELYVPYETFRGKPVYYNQPYWK